MKIKTEINKERTAKTHTQEKGEVNAEMQMMQGCIEGLIETEGERDGIGKRW